MDSAPKLEQCFSGITYHLGNAGMEAGKLEGMFSLHSGSRPSRRLQMLGLTWKLRRMFLGQKSHGFKFTSSYADELWPRYIECLAGTTLVNNFQLFGKEFFKRRRNLDISACFYIDGTLAEYFETYLQFDVANIDASTMTEAMKIEKDGYAEADSIVAMSERTALSLRERYGVAPEKISIIPPGANLSDSDVESADLEPSVTSNGEFVLGFVGLYPLRKGLDRLARAMQILRGDGLPIRLRVIGNCPDDLKGIEGLDYLGKIDKTSDTAAFIEAISGVHLGCLLSRAELTGIATLEFLRLGIPVIGTNVGGAPDILGGGGSVMVSPAITAEELAEVLRKLYEDRVLYAKLKVEAASRKRWASWTRVAEELDLVLP
jgi:glycosyltransferase involved in cell wall biosynthesis